MRRGWGWAGTAAELVETADQPLVDALTQHHSSLLGLPPSFEQLRVWRQEAAVLRAALSGVAAVGIDVTRWGLALEYELPLEGGRRPDAVVLADGHVVVIEFKSATRVEQAHLDQVAAYSRDLSEYHAASHGRQVRAVLALPNVETPVLARDDVVVCDGASLGAVLLDLAGDGQPVSLDAWLEAPYAPLPTLVAAARRIFEHEPLPRIRRAESAHIPETVALLEALAAEARSHGQRKLILVGGVPGAGKTLAGLSLVYAASGLEADATFLSGNGPLVKVLQDALQSRVFVRDLHKFIGDYGLKGRDPQHHIVVFDEAQRMWDRRYMGKKRDVEASEPDLLISTGDRLPGWAALVGLVGEGQEIYVGEEGGLGLWANALAQSSEHWEVHGPPGIADIFPGHEVLGARPAHAQGSVALAPSGAPLRVGSAPPAGVTSARGPESQPRAGRGIPDVAHARPGRGEGVRAAPLRGRTRSQIRTDGLVARRPQAHPARSRRQLPHDGAAEQSHRTMVQRGA
jgi:hypothetical protein